MDKILLTEIGRDEDLRGLAETLIGMRKHETIPAPQRRAAIRARLVESFAKTDLAVIETRIGWIGLAWNSRGLVALNLPRPTRARALRDLQREYPEGVLQDAAPSEMLRELREYAEGRRRVFDLPLDWSSIKPFQRAVLRAASHIPFGETRSYGWIAQRIGNPKAARAVGQALGANPIPIVLPCHRVIASSGKLGGYGGGLPMKVMLLKLEGATLNL